MDEPTKASWYISVTADSNCICTVMAIRSPSPLSTSPWMSCEEDSDKEGSGTSRLNYPDHGLKTSCVKGGTHPTSSGAAVDVCRDAPAGAQRAERAADGGVIDVSRALSMSPSAPRIHAQRVARFDP